MRGIYPLFSPFQSGFGLGRIIASTLYAITGIVVMSVVVMDLDWRKEVNMPYIDTIEGTLILILVVCLSTLSFVTVVDRTPTSLAGTELSPEGLFLEPKAVLFPVEISPAVVAYAIAVSVVLVVLGRIFNQKMLNVSDETHDLTCRIALFISLLFISVILLLAETRIPGGIEIEGRSLLATPLNGLIMIVVMWGLLIVSIPVYTYPLLPDWVTDKKLSRDRQQELLEYHIASNWRLARVLTTLVFTGAVGITLSFVFGRASPNFFFVLAIVGSVTIGPLGVVWFLMRRIREAEKELRPNPP